MRPLTLLLCAPLAWVCLWSLCAFSAAESPGKAPNIACVAVATATATTLSSCGGVLRLYAPGEGSTAPGPYVVVTSPRPNATRSGASALLFQGGAYESLVGWTFLAPWLAEQGLVVFTVFHRLAATGAWRTRARCRTPREPRAWFGRAPRIGGSTAACSRLERAREDTSRRSSPRTAPRACPRPQRAGQRDSRPPSPRSSSPSRPWSSWSPRACPATWLLARRSSGDGRLKRRSPSSTTPCG